MSNNDDETQLELSEDDISNGTQNIRMMDFGDEIKIIMENFKNCEKIEVKQSDGIAEHIKEVKKLNGIFREFVKESINLSDQLEKYSYKILRFTKRFKDTTCSDERISNLLKSHLKDSQRNYELAKKLKNRLENDEETDGILSELFRIQNSTYKHIVGFEKEIDSSKKQIALYKGGKFYTACVFMLLKLAEFLDKFTEGNYKEFVAEKAKKRLEDEKQVFRNQLDVKRNKLDMVKLFDENLSSIIKGVGRIETFWDMQIRSIEYLIEDLKGLKSSGRERDTQCQIVDAIEQKWQNVGNECQLYYITMKKLLHENRIARE